MTIQPSISKKVKFWSLSLLLLPAIASCNTQQPSTSTQPENQPPPVATTPSTPVVITPTDPAPIAQAPNRSAEITRFNKPNNVRAVI